MSVVFCVTGINTYYALKIVITLYFYLEQSQVTCLYIIHIIGLVILLIDLLDYYHISERLLLSEFLFGSLGLYRDAT